MAQVTCAQCQAKLVVPELQAKRGKCPKCGGSISGHPSLRSSDARPAPLTATDAAPLPLTEESVAASPKPARPAAPSSQRVIAPPDDEQGEAPEELALSDEPAAAPQHAPALGGPQQAQQPTPGGLVVTQERGATIAAFQNHRILDAVVIETVGQELASLLDDRDNRKAILDFGKVEFLSSQMIGVLLSCQKKAAAAGKRIILCALAPGLQKLFKIVGLERAFQITADRQSALLA